MLKGLAAKTLAEKGITEEQKKTLSHCIEQTEKLFEDKTEFGDEELESYHHWNVIFHDTVIQGAGNIALMQALAKNNQLPMASAQALTYDQSRALSEYRRLHYAHLQHCSVYDICRAPAGALQISYRHDFEKTPTHGLDEMYRRKTAKF